MCPIDARAKMRAMTVQLSVAPNPKVPLSVVYEDPAFIVVDKPAGVVTQPGRKHTRDTLLNGVFASHGKSLQNVGKTRDFGLVHRLDRPTSGLVLVALEQDAYDHLRAQFAERRIKKTYLALVAGAPQPPSGAIRAPIREVRQQGRKRAVLGSGRGSKPAVTAYETLVRARGAALLLCRPETGRLHQIRAHLAQRGCPVLGDDEYGKGLDPRLGRRIGLHAASLTLTHPTTGRTMIVTSPLPADLRAACDALALAVPRAWR